MRSLSILQSSIINSIRNHPGIGSTALAEAMGRDRRQINKAALRLVELGHCSVRRTDAGDFFSIHREQIQRQSELSPAVKTKAHVAADLHIERPTPRVDRNEPLEAKFKVIEETSKPSFAGAMIHRSPAVRGYKPPRAPALGTALIVHDPMGAHFRQQAARLAELESAELEREESARRAASPQTVDMVQASARMALDALMAWGSLADPPESRQRQPRSHKDEWSTPCKEPEPAPALASVAAPMADAEAAVPFWRRRARIEQPPAKRSVWF
jgi:hypothetical protein